MSTRVPRGTVAAPAHTVTHPSVDTQAGLQATMAVVTTGAGLVAVKPRPAWLARALAFQWVTAECVCFVAEAGVFTVKAVGAVPTHPLSALGSSEARLTQTASVDVIAASPVGTVAHTLTVPPITTHLTLLTAPVSSEAFSTLALACLRVAVAPVVTHTLLGTARTKPALCTALCTHLTRPPRGARTDPFPLANAPVLARASQRASTLWACLLTECPSEIVSTQALSGHFIAGTPSSTLALLKTALAKGAWWAGVLTAAPNVAWRTLAGTGHRIAQATVLTLTQLTTTWTPVFVIAGTGTVVATPASLTLAAVWSNTSPMDTLLSTAGDTFVSALVVARATLVPPAVVHLHRLSVCCLIGDPVTGASVGGAWLRARFLCHLVIRVGVRLLH